MSHGKIIALDTPTALKRNFGVGYDLLIENLKDGDESELPVERLDQVVIDMDLVDGAVRKE